VCLGVGVFLCVCMCVCAYVCGCVPCVYVCVDTLLDRYLNAIDQIVSPRLLRYEPMCIRLYTYV
jgi:hypothetical protein